MGEPRVFLGTNRLDLRPLTCDDLDDLLALDTDPLVQRFTEDGEEVNVCAHRFARRDRAGPPGEIACNLEVGA